MAYKVLFFNSQSGCGFISDFITVEAADFACIFFKERHYNNSAVVLNDYPEVKSVSKAKK
jgi:hypothetical protein